MSALSQSLGEPFVRWLAHALIDGTVAALLTWLLCATLLRRARPALLCALWLVVLLKFIVPVGPGSPVSLSTGVVHAAHWAHPPAATKSAPAAARHAAVAALTDDADIIPITATAGDAAAEARTAGAPASNWGAWSALAYITLLVAVGGRRIRAYRRFSAAVAGLPRADEATRGFVGDLCRRAGLSARPDVRVAPDSPAPFVYGLLRPTIVLAAESLGRRDELETVVAHEIAHLRRGDLWALGLQWLAGTLLFFWPVVAWVNRRLDLAREQACDEWALRHGPLSAAQYARCLLDCAQRRSGAAAYRPAAMAANPRHVMRRIEVILNDSTRNTRHSFGLAAGALLIGWAGFVLAGAHAETAPQKQMQGQTMIVQSADGAELHEHLIFLETHGAPLDASPSDTVFLRTADGEDGDEMMVWVARTSDKELAAFGEAHPQADLDADGLISKEERDAYLVAVAMSDPLRVLGQFPKSDRDADGALAAREAARLVTVGMLPEPGELPARMPRGMFFSHDGAEAPADLKARVQRIQDGEPAVQVFSDMNVQPEDVQIEEVDGRKIVRVQKVSESDGAQQRIEVRVGDDGQFDIDHRVDRDGATVQDVLIPRDPARWIEQNIAAAPAGATAAVYVPLVRQAPLDAFLELNPKADANGDGVLTAEERDTFVERLHTRMRQRMLERFPQADANGDGLLTDEELRDHMRSRHGAWISQGAEGEAGAHVIVELETDDEPK